MVVDIVVAELDCFVVKWCYYFHVSHVHIISIHLDNKIEHC